MKQLNVSISDEAYQLAKLAADQDGMLLRKWVERAITGHAQPRIDVHFGESAEANARRLVPLDNL